MKYSQIYIFCRSLPQQESQNLNLLKKCDFKNMKFPVKIRVIHKIGKKNSIGISVFGYKNKEKYLIYVSKKYYVEKNIELLLIGEEGKMKHETGGVEIEEFVGLKPKMYSFLVDNYEHKRLKMWIKMLLQQ